MRDDIHFFLPHHRINIIININNNKQADSSVIPQEMNDACVRILLLLYNKRCQIGNSLCVLTFNVKICALIRSE